MGRTGYETLLLTKEESEGEFVNTGGQHTVTYSADDKLSEEEYYLYMFNNNLGVSESRVIMIGVSEQESNNQ